MSATKLPNYSVSVRALADFCLQEGDLVSSNRPTPSALEGQQTHKLIQRQRGGDYQAEVSFTLLWQTKKFEFLLRGRADGVVASGVEEIKTTRIPPGELPESATDQHWLQCKLYAALLAVSRPDLQWVEYTLCFVHSQTQQEWPVTRREQRDALIDFLVDCCSRYERWLDQLQNHMQQRAQYCQQLTFPYPSMRRGQRQMAEDVYKSCITGQNLCVQAPTGTGKTLAALFPALKAVHRADIQTLFFLTMKTTGQVAAFDALDKLDPDHHLNVVSLTAKPRLCLSEEGVCDGSLCPYAADYFAKRTRLREELFSHRRWNIEQLKSFGEHHQICPYYLSQDWAIWADIVVGDINYIYDTTAVQPLLLKEIDNNACILIDESHNLIDRGRMIFSTGFWGKELQQLIRQCPKGIQAALRKIQTSLRNEYRDTSEGLHDQPPNSLTQKLRDFIALSPTLLRENPGFEPPLLWQDFIFRCVRFVRLHELAEAGDFVWRYRAGKPEQRSIELLCLNPARLLQQKHQLVNNVVAFSATLKPWDYSLQLNGLNDAVFNELPSPFESDQFQVYIAEDVSTRYRDRHHLPALLRDTLQQLIDDAGNSMVFFSSYQQLRACTERLTLDNNCELQSTDWDEQKRAAVLARFRQEQGLTLFTVLGGVFAEGIDLPGTMLETVVVVGPGLSQVNDVNNAIRDRLNRQSLPGFDYAYVYPGLQKVLQAAGRCIRTEQDRGRILMIDDRFKGYRQQQLLPDFWTIRCGELRNWTNDPATSS